MGYRTTRTRTWLAHAASISIFVCVCRTFNANSSVWRVLSCWAQHLRGLGGRGGRLGRRRGGRRRGRGGGRLRRRGGGRLRRRGGGRRRRRGGGRLRRRGGGRLRRRGGGRRRRRGGGGWLWGCGGGRLRLLRGRLQRADHVPRGVTNKIQFLNDNWHGVVCSGIKLLPVTDGLHEHSNIGC